MRPAGSPGTHLLRPVPPWRESRTWCGLAPGGLAIVSPEEFSAMRRDEDARGLRFTGRATCARCRCQDGDRRASWNRDPVDVVGLDCISPRWEPWRAMLRPELRALAALAARHRQEFRTLVERETVLEALTDGPG